MLNSWYVFAYKEVATEWMRRSKTIIEFDHKFFILKTIITLLTAKCALQKDTASGSMNAFIFAFYKSSSCTDYPPTLQGWFFSFLQNPSMELTI